MGVPLRPDGGSAVVVCGYEIAVCGELAVSREERGVDRGGEGRGALGLIPGMVSRQR